jgi:hypothetical protein
MAPYGTIKKCDIPVNFHWGIEIPFFSNDTLDVHWKTYKVTAAVAHLGMDAAGHCRSLMKVKMNATADQPYMFLLTDDWEQATPVWKERSQHGSSVTFLASGCATVITWIYMICHQGCCRTPPGHLILQADQ